MADEQQAKPKESADTPEPVPSSKETPSGKDEASPQGESQSPAKEEMSLPDNVKERTAEQFEKLKEQLRQEKAQRLRLERVYQQIPQPNQEEKPDYFDPSTGEVDVNKLQSHISRTENMAKQAIATAQKVVQENDKKQERVAYKAHPELDPSKDGFNEDFHKAVIGYLAGQFAEGKNMTLKQAADKVKTFSKVKEKEAEKQGAKKALEQLSPKEQAAMEADTGRSDQRRNVSKNLDRLQQGTRQGDLDSIVERLKNVQ